MIVFIMLFLRLEHGVTHNSILGPLFFLLHVNDLSQGLSEAGSYLYANDTFCHYVSGS